MHHLQVQVEHEVETVAPGSDVRQSFNLDIFSHVKERAKATMTAIEHSLTQLLANKVSCILLGDRSPLIAEDVTEQEMRDARLLWKKSVRDSRANGRGEVVTPEQFLRFEDKLTNAMMNQIAADLKHGKNYTDDHTVWLIRS